MKGALLATDGVRVEEAEPWREGSEMWRDEFRMTVLVTG